MKEFPGAEASPEQSFASTATRRTFSKLQPRRDRRGSCRGSPAEALWELHGHQTGRAWFGWLQRLCRMDEQPGLSGQLTFVLLILQVLLQMKTQSCSQSHD